MQPVTKPSGRRAIAAILTLAFLAFYVWAVIAIGEHLPDHWLAQLAFYGLAGISGACLSCPCSVGPSGAGGRAER